MDNFFKYLTPGKRDKHWGIYLNLAGFSTIPPNTHYPSTEHPKGYYIFWEKGRILSDYQLIYITEGEGLIETKYEQYEVSAGSMLILTPNIWHRYRPIREIGWKEYYVGFNGSMFKQFISYPYLPTNQPILNIGIKEEVLDTYLKIFDLVKTEKPGYQQIASGLVIKLLGYLISFQMQKNFSNEFNATIVEEIRFKMREYTDGNLDLENLVSKYNISYSHFRKMFKNYTGVSPHQYYLELKIMHAKELLISSKKSIKEISFEIGFQSISHFSRYFKKKIGVPPSYYRK